MRFHILSVLAVAAGLSLLSGDDQGVDTVTTQATKLEADLAKLRSTSTEAAEVMVKLADLYYQHGRVFGLIRVGQSFVTLHVAHPRHKDVMRKLMDGLLVTGRNKEVIATARQFVVRYPKDPASADVERLLAELLTRSGETAAAAGVNEARWRRLGATPEGRSAGTQAVAQYAALEQSGQLHARRDARRRNARQAPGRPRRHRGRLVRGRSLGARQQLGQGESHGHQAAAEIATH